MREKRKWNHRRPIVSAETGARTPKADLTASLANALGVSPLALSVPPACMKCSAPGVKPLPCSRLGRSAKRTMIVGVTATRSSLTHRAGSSQSLRD